MPPYEPLYLRQAKAERDLFFREYIRVCDVYEETENRALLKRIEYLDQKCIEADREVSVAWNRWIGIPEQILKETALVSPRTESQNNTDICITDSVSLPQDERQNNAEIRINR